MNNENEFEITNEHLTLLKNMYVSWCDDEYGAPEINPKRPYGNGDVANDIIRLLNWEDIDSLDEEEEEDFYEGTQYTYLCECAERIHKETETVLQIVLAVGRFETGTYVRPDSYSDDWKLKE